MQRLLELFGSRTKLARLLQVPEDDLQRWLNDKAKPPLGIFLRAVDLLLAETDAAANDGDPSAVPPDQDCAAGDTRYWLD